VQIPALSNGPVSGVHYNFTSKYNVVKFVYFEEFNSTNDSHSRENQIKKYRREKKIKLIEAMNPNWIDLYDTF
jgi:putative endonuclease